MRFLVDEQLPPILAEWLRERGHQADHLHDLDLDAASDREVWRQASQTQAVIVTKDGDFAAWRRATAGPQVLWLRIGNCRTSVLLERLSVSWPDVLGWLEGGESIVELI